MERWLIYLNDHQEAVADLIARRCNDQAHVRGYQPSGGSRVNDGNPIQYQRNLTGRRAEIGAAALLDLALNFQRIDEEKSDGSTDLSHRIGVRGATKRKGLLVRDSDPADGRFVAAHVVDNRVLLMGWEIVEVARRPQWIDDPDHRQSPCYILPERYLQPMERLERLIAEERIAALTDGIDARVVLGL